MNLLSIHNFPYQSLLSEQMQIVSASDNKQFLVFIVCVIIIGECIFHLQEHIRTFVDSLLSQIIHVALISGSALLLTDAPEY